VLAWLLAGGGEKSCVLAGDRLIVICLLVSCIKEELVLGCFLLLNTESAAHGSN
jgi:hypothetical protein